MRCRAFGRDALLRNTGSFTKKQAIKFGSHSCDITTDNESALRSRQVRDDFDLGGLWEHVERCDRKNREALLQFGEVAGQRRWVA